MALTTTAPISIWVENLWVVKGGGFRTTRRSILQNIAFQVQPGDFVAIIGPNGAGKTTMFKALVGDKPYSGRILFSQDDGQFESLYENPEYWLERIGYVPVDNVLHEELTVRQVLMHIGRLRRPDLTDDEILERIAFNLDGLGIPPEDPRVDQLVKTLSSGERKKVNIAAEMLTDPPLLLLDEPTSNLDPNAERDLMDSLRRLSATHNEGNGPTILLITHTLSSLDRCDHIVFIANSKLVCEGSPDDVFETLEQNIVDAGRSIPDSSNKFEHWATIFDYYKTQDFFDREHATPPEPQHYPSVETKQRKVDSSWRQFRILFSRYFLGRYNDLGGIFTILFSGFVAGFLLLIAPSEVFLKAKDASAARQTVVLFAILVVITGAFNSHREISKEFRIYIHERVKGLDPLAYVMSKVVWLSVVIGIFVCLTILALTGMPIARTLTFVVGLGLVGAGLVDIALHHKTRWKTTSSIAWRIGQVLLLVLPLFAAYFIQFQNKELPNTPVQASSVELSIIVTLCLTGIAALSLGLLVSSVVGANNDRATQIAIGVIIANVILAFSVLVVTSPKFRVFFATLEPFTVTHWGYSGFSSSLNLYCWAGSLRYDDFNSVGHILSTWLYLLLQIVVAIGGSILALRLQETWTTRGRLLRSLAQQKVTWFFILTVTVLMSWAVFLGQQSQNYYTLTYFDAIYSGNRYANIETVANATFFQRLNGALSESACVLRGTSQSSDKQDASQDTGSIQ
ncbi:MAG: ATP-binding cassette domain-containing protein [Chloroflexota bacterium]